MAMASSGYSASHFAGSARIRCGKSRVWVEQRRSRWYGVTVCLSKGSRPWQEIVMAERIETKAFVHQLALRMQTNDQVASAWLEATVETLYDTFKAGKGVTLTGLGG